MSKPPVARGTPLLRVTSPCPMRWEALPPVDGGRHCDVCRKTVIDVERLSSAELDALVESSERACVRVTTFADGTVLTRDHPRVPRRTAAWAGAAFAASTLACSEAVADDEIAWRAESSAPAAPPSTLGESRIEAEAPPVRRPIEPAATARVGRLVAVTEIGGVEPELRGGIEPPPEMPELDLHSAPSRPRNESAFHLGGEEEATVTLGGIGEAEPILGDDISAIFKSALSRFQPFATRGARAREE